MRIQEEKLKNIAVFLYVRETVGKNLFSEIHLYPQLEQECDALAVIATQFEISVLTGGNDYQTLKEQTIEKILSIHNIASGIEKYRQSLIFFDESGNVTDLI